MMIRAFTANLAAVAAVMSLAAPAVAQEQPQHQPDHLQHRFDDAERFSRSFDDPERDAWQMPSRVIDALGLKPDATVADLGAGTGYFSVRLAKVVPQGTVYAVDIEPAMLDFLRKRVAAENATNVSPVQAEASDPRLPRPVDAVLIVNTYHHLPNRVSYFTTLRRSLTSSGLVAIVDYHKNSPSGPPVEFRFEATQIIDEMRAAGYRLEAQHDFLPRQHFLVFRPEGTPR
jgi:ubiquinone/menaquinone biosynthesis C-methylase UbiE